MFPLLQRSQHGQVVTMVTTNKPFVLRSESLLTRLIMPQLAAIPHIEHNNITHYTYYFI